MRTTYERALSISESRDRPKRERFELMRHLTTLSMVGDIDIYRRVAPEFSAQVAADAGLHAYWAHAELRDPAERLRAALTDTQARYEATPAHDRVYSLDDALRRLAIHVASSIGIGARALDSALLSGLPAMLEPFLSMSPILVAIWENVEATCDSVFRARPERAVARWQRVYERLEGIGSEPNIEILRAAVAYGIGEATANLGLSALAMQWIERLDREPLQRVNAMRVRRIVCLQHGDWTGAERAREQAELMGLQANGRQIFESPLRSELYAHWLARDLAGVKQAADSIARLAPIYPGWRVHHRLAQGYFDALRGDASSALVAFEDCVAHSQPDTRDPDRSSDAWLRASAAALSMLLELDRVDEARGRGEHVLEQSETLSIAVSAQRVARELALAEARSGHAQRAIARSEAVITDQCERGVRGVQLGASYEARARVAVALRSEADLARYAALAAREFMHGPGSTLAARCGRLLQEAGRAGMRIPSLAQTRVVALPATSIDPKAAAVARALGELHGNERARHALQLLCEHGQAAGGYLYLSRGDRADLMLLASSVEAPPSEALIRFAAAFWRQQLEEAEMSAVLTELPWTHDSHEPRTWIDPQGSRYEVLELYSPQSLPPQVGLAILRIEAREKNPGWSTAVLSAVAIQVRELLV